MAQADNPLLPIQDKVVRIHSRLLDFLRNVVLKLKPIMATLQGFLINVKKVAKDIAKTVGKSVVDNIIKTGTKLLQVFAFVQKLVFDGVKFATKILTVIKKAIKEPEKVFKVVKAMTARFAKLFRTIVAKVAEVMVLLNPVEIVLAVINTMKMMLQMVFRWVSDVSNISSGVKKAKAMMRKSFKLLKVEAKRVTEVVKEANKLKPA
ncbi:MAG: hypothetical protein AAF727_04300 [Pseudomonadota bacterium]